MPQGRILLKSISESQKLPKLKTDGARLLYTWLISHLDINGCFSGNAEVIKGKVFTRLKKSTKAIEDYLKDMEDVRLIIRYEINGDLFLHSPDFVKKQPQLNPKKEGKPHIPKPPLELLQSYSEVTPDQVRNNSTQSKGKESKEKLKVKERKDSIKAIIDYFNKITGQKRSYDSDNTNKFINGRLEEGKTFEDFKHVIDTKTSQWLKDEKMGKYLRPSTLFTPGKFEDYLNESYEDPKRKKYRVGENVEKPTKEEDEFTKARNIQVEKIYKGHEKEIEQARKDGDKDKYDKIQNQIKIELADWSREYHKSKPPL